VIASREQSPRDESSTGSASAGRLHLKILLNLSPVDPDESILKPADAAVLLSMLRGITEQPVVSGFDLLAFNVREQKIIYREENVAEVDYYALGQAVLASKPGTIDYRRLGDARGATQFIAQLLTDQLGAGASSPDAIVIVGPKVSLEKRVPLQALREAGSAPCPIYYLSYNSNSAEPGRDTIRSALKAYKTAMAYNLLFPGDLAAALSDILSRAGQEPASPDLE
jgi:hypothetical protein